MGKRSVEYLEKRIAALEAFHSAAQEYFSSCAYCIEDVIDAKVLEEVEATRPLTPQEQQDRLRKWITDYMSKLPQEVDDATRDYVLNYITAHQMSPAYTGQSLHIWEEHYIVEGVTYMLWGHIGGQGIISGVGIVPR